MELFLWIVAIATLIFLLSLTPLGTDFRKRMMAKFYTVAQKNFEPYIAERKRSLFADLSGTVLEIGPGNGANFVHLPKGVSNWIGIEPNPHMHKELRSAAEACDIEAEFRTVTAAGMEVADASVDVVLSTLVLCSVPNPVEVVREIHRILKPGGRFVFIEHVAAPRGTRLRRAQRLAKPLWWYVADGCRPDRDLADVIQGGGFAEVTFDEFRVPAGIVPAVVSPQVSGVATKSMNQSAP